MAFLLLIAFVVGLNVVVTEPGWGAKVGGALASLTSASLVALVICYRRRPVAWHGLPVDQDAVAAWTEELARRGRVDVRLDWGKGFLMILGIVVALGAVAFSLLVATPYSVLIGVASLVVFSYGAIHPLPRAGHGQGPVVAGRFSRHRARSLVSLGVPWAEVRAVRARPSRTSACKVLVQVTDAFFQEYARSRPLPLRVTDAINRRGIGSGFLIPALTAADPETLSAWIASEAQRRNRNLAS